MIRLTWPPPQRRRSLERSRDRLVRARRPRSHPSARGSSQRIHAVCLGRRLVPEVRGELPVAVARPRSLATRKLVAGGAVRRWLWARWRPLAPHALPALLAALCLAFSIGFTAAVLHLEALMEGASSSSSDSAR